MARIIVTTERSERPDAPVLLDELLPRKTSRRSLSGAADRATGLGRHRRRGRRAPARRPHHPRRAGQEGPRADGRATVGRAAEFDSADRERTISAASSKAHKE